MKRWLVCGFCAVMVLLPMGAVFGDMLYNFENPPYVAGDGVVQDAPGQWHYWGNTPGVDLPVITDPTNAANQVVRISDPTYIDVTSNYFTSPLSGTCPRLSLDVYLTNGADGGGSPNAIPCQVNWGPGSLMDVGTYNNVLTNFFIQGTATGRWDVNGATVTNLSLNAWHHVDIFASDLGSNVGFSFYADGVGSGATVTLPKASEGLNAIEIGTGVSDGNTNTYVLADNVTVAVPEPSAMVLLIAGVASVALAFWRRRRR